MSVGYTIVAVDLPRSYAGVPQLCVKQNTTARPWLAVDDPNIGGPRSATERIFFGFRGATTSPCCQDAKVTTRTPPRRNALRTAPTLSFECVSATWRCPVRSDSINPVRGPAYQSADLMIGKTFALTDRIRAEFRAEAFNVTNTPPLGQPNGSFGSPAFGSITSALNPRVFELVLKFHF
jgi:hypothetical protein